MRSIYSWRFNHIRRLLKKSVCRLSSQVTRPADEPWSQVNPVPQNDPHVSAGMSVLNFPDGEEPESRGVKSVVRALLMRVFYLILG